MILFDSSVACVKTNLLSLHMLLNVSSKVAHSGVHFQDLC